jgi:hypothetical protein
VHELVFNKVIVVPLSSGSSIAVKLIFIFPFYGHSLFKMSAVAGSTIEID